MHGPNSVCLKMHCVRGCTYTQCKVILCVQFVSCQSVCIYRSMVMQYGLWDQIRVNKGTEWVLMLHVQDTLAEHRNCIIKPTLCGYYLQEGNLVFNFVYTAPCVTAYTFYLGVTGIRERLPSMKNLPPAISLLLTSSFAWVSNRFCLFSSSSFFAIEPNQA